jgi:hypothetical protein
MTPADKPELPEPDSTMEITVIGMPVEIDTYRASTMVDYAARIEAWARADERRKALEEAAQACTSTMLMNVESYCGATAHTCADLIRTLIDKEPT